MNKRESVERIIENIEKVIIGKREVIEKVVIGILCDGHVLLEDSPGVGKTMLVKAISKSLNLNFKRIQFTPDLMPSDITGISVYNQKEKEFIFKKGPVFTNLLLGDEINRTSPKTQAALLEAMEEKQISEGLTTYQLENPFFVIATQNSMDNEGTYPLPEAQLDRFLMKISMGFPKEHHEVMILEKYKSRMPLEEIGAVCCKEELLAMQEEVKQVQIKRVLQEYIVKIVRKTRESKFVTIGASTRGAIHLLRVSCASAYIAGRDYVITDDIKRHAVEVLKHRLMISPWAKADGVSSEAVIKQILAEIDVPQLV